MIIAKFYSLEVGGVKIKNLVVPITVVDSYDETRCLCMTHDGKYYWRNKRNVMTLDEFTNRCKNVVTVESYPRADAESLGMPLICFARGEEGNMSQRIGMPSTAIERERSKESHRKYREAHLLQMGRNQARYKEEEGK